MNLIAPTTGLMLAAALVVLLTLTALLRTQSRRRRKSREVRDALDTMMAWPPSPVRVMTVAERSAYDTLHKAMPGHMVLAQVPLSRFLRVPTRHSYSEWLQRVGFVSADLLICDAGSRVLAVVDIRSASESQRSRRRHERMGEVLRAAQIAVLVWDADRLPTVEQVRAQMIPILQEVYGKKEPSVSQPPVSKPLPLIPVAEMEELLAAGDAAAMAHNDAAMEPVPSTLFDEFEETPAVAMAGARR